MRIVAFIAAALAATASHAGMPPERYDHPYKGLLKEQRVRLGKAYSACQALAHRLGRPATHNKFVNGRHLYGCSHVKDGVAYIVFSYDPSGADPHMEDNVRRHEIGHANGWPADHPDSR